MQNANTEITIRRVDLIEEDLIALTRLADRDSGTVPNSPVLGLEVEGVLLAAVSLRDGETIADPFLPTEELRDLLGARASQLRRRARSTRRLPGLSRRQGRPAVGGSPPGQIITLPRWG
jgi:hypothetical protein